MKKIFLTPLTFIKKNYIIIIFLIIYFIITNLIFHNSCLLKLIIGLPCPACGITRAWANFIMFDFDKAFFYHPLFLIVIPISIIILYKEDFKITKRLYNSKLFWIILIILIINVYIYRFITIYPNAPFDINQNSLLLSIIRFIKHIFSH